MYFIIVLKRLLHSIVMTVNLALLIIVNPFYRHDSHFGN